MKKSDLRLHEGIEASIKLGSLVTIKDGSYIISEEKITTTKITRVGSVILKVTEINTLVKEGSLGWSEDVYRIIDINKPFPTPKNDLGNLQAINNCKIQSTEDDSIHYCSNLNIRNIKNCINF